MRSDKRFLHVKKREKTFLLFFQCEKSIRLSLRIGSYLIRQFIVSAYREHDASFKEVIQPQVPLRLPCYDFTPVMNHTVVIALQS